MFTPNEDKLIKSGPIWHGTAIAWHNDLSSSVQQLESSHDRFTVIKLASESTSIVLISLYAPTSGQDDDYLECISHLSEFLLTNVSENDAVVIGTDCNCSPKSTPR